MPKSIMVNNDGHGVFSKGYDSKEAIEESQEVYRGHVRDGPRVVHFHGNQSQLPL